MTEIIDEDGNFKSISIDFNLKIDFLEKKYLLSLGNKLSEIESLGNIQSSSGIKVSGDGTLHFSIGYDFTGEPIEEDTEIGEYLININMVNAKKISSIELLGGAFNTDISFVLSSTSGDETVNLSKTDLIDNLSLEDLKTDIDSVLPAGYTVFVSGNRLQILSSQDFSIKSSSPSFSLLGFSGANQQTVLKQTYSSNTGELKLNIHKGTEPVEAVRIDFRDNSFTSEIELMKYLNDYLEDYDNKITSKNGEHSLSNLYGLYVANVVTNGSDFDIYFGCDRYRIKGYVKGNDYYSFSDGDLYFMLESTEIQHSGQFYKQVENLIESVDVLIESVDVEFMITLGSDQIKLTVDTSKCMSLSDLVKK